MAGLDYNALVEMIRNNIADVMTDPFYDGYDIEVTNEMQFLEKKEGYRNRIYIVVKFAPATTFFGQTVLSFTVTAISEHNHCFVCQKLLSDYAQKYNLEQTGYIQQIYETPSVILNFNEIYEGFAAVMAMSGTFVIAKDIARISFEYIYTDKNQLLDAGKRFPGIGKALQVITGSRVTQVVKIVDSQHSSLLPVAALGSHLSYYTTKSRRLSILFRINLQI